MTQTTQEATLRPHPITRPFRFGIASAARTVADVTEQARTVEAFGCATLLVSDHLDLSGAHVSRLMPLQLLAAAAAVTSDLRLGTQMLNQDLRHPAVLAREAASLQILSGGRFELGIGAGWNQQEYDWSGIPFDPVGVRIDRLGEYLEIVTRLQCEESVDHAGRHFTLSSMPGYPGDGLPAMRLLMGGGGRRMLSLAARTADTVSVAVFTSPGKSAAELDERIAWIADAAGDRLAHLEISLPIIGVIPGGGDPLELVRRARAEGSVWGLALASGLTDEEVLASPCFLVGSPARMVEELLERRERWGVSYPTFSHDDVDAIAPVIAALAGV